VLLNGTLPAGSWQLPGGLTAGRLNLTSISVAPTTCSVSDLDPKPREVRVLIRSYANRLQGLRTFAAQTPTAYREMLDANDRLLSALDG
jgi:hypothetical protein